MGLETENLEGCCFWTSCGVKSSSLFSEGLETEILGSCFWSSFVEASGVFSDGHAVTVNLDRLGTSLAGAVRISSCDSP